MIQKRSKHTVTASEASGSECVARLLSNFPQSALGNSDVIFIKMCCFSQKSETFELTICYNYLLYRYLLSILVLMFCILNKTTFFNGTISFLRSNETGTNV